MADESAIEIKPGVVLFFKKARLSSNRKSPEISFKGHGFGVILGIVPHFQPDPPREHLLRLMGHAGFFAFDDIKEFLSEASQIEFIEKFKTKYYGPVMEEKTPTVSPILGADGKPILCS